MVNEESQNLYLNDADAAELDALIEKRCFAQAAASTSSSPQQSGPKAVLALLDQYPQPQLPAALAQRVKHNIQALNRTSPLAEDLTTVNHAAISLGADRAKGFGFWGFSLGDVAGVAAVLIAGLSLTIAMFGDYRMEQRRLSDMADMGLAGGAFVSYANDHAGRLPRRASLGNRWDGVGKNPDESNSANLFKLVSQGYLGLKSLSSADNPDAPETLKPGAQDWENYNQVSYSYLNQFRKKSVVLTTVNQPLALLANKNPHFIQAGNRLKFRYHPGGSSFYNGKGQVILMFRGDIQSPQKTSPAQAANHNRVDWNTDQKINDHDHIYLIDRGDHELREYQGTEVPDRLSDNHLIP